MRRPTKNRLCFIHKIHPLIEDAAVCYVHIWTDLCSCNDTIFWSSAFFFSFNSRFPFFLCKLVSLSVPNIILFSFSMTFTQGCLCVYCTRFCIFVYMFVCVCVCYWARGRERKGKGGEWYQPIWCKPLTTEWDYLTLKDFINHISSTQCHHSGLGVGVCV